MAEYRVNVVGAGAVGKSALTVRYIAGSFVERYDPTIEDSYRKQVEIEDQACLVDILDTAGQEELSALSDQYMKNGQGSLLVFSIENRLSFEHTSKLRQTVLRMKPGFPDFPMVLIGNKKDLESNRQVSEEEAKQVAERYRIPYLETSAKTNENVKEGFELLLIQINKWRRNHPDQGDKPVGKRKQKICIIL